jgi:hypothetical protein
MRRPEKTPRRSLDIHLIYSRPGRRTRTTRTASISIGRTSLTAEKSSPSRQAIELKVLDVREVARVCPSLAQNVERLESTGACSLCWPLLATQAAEANEFLVDGRPVHFFKNKKQTNIFGH